MADCILRQSRPAFIKQYKTHPGSKSKIWKYFGFLSDNDGTVKVTPDEIICELCNERIKCSNNTTNLLTHLIIYLFDIFNSPIQYDANMITGATVMGSCADGKFT